MKKETLTNIYAIHFNELLVKILENIRDFKLNKFDIVIYDNNYRNIIIEYIMKYHFEEMRDNISSFKLVESKDVKDIKNETALKKEIKISLNKATLDELLQISGIGESKAKAILTYREENGEFKSIEDIKNVSGIGEALFEKIKDQITV